MVMTSASRKDSCDMMMTRWRVTGSLRHRWIFASAQFFLRREPADGVAGLDAEEADCARAGRGVRGAPCGATGKPTVSGAVPRAMAPIDGEGEHGRRTCPLRPAGDEGLIASMSAISVAGDTLDDVFGPFLQSRRLMPIATLRAAPGATSRRSLGYVVVTRGVSRRPRRASDPEASATPPPDHG